MEMFILESSENKLQLRLSQLIIKLNITLKEEMTFGIETNTSTFGLVIYQEVWEDMLNSQEEMLSQMELLFTMVQLEVKLRQELLPIIMLEELLFMRLVIG